MVTVMYFLIRVVIIITTITTTTYISRITMAYNMYFTLLLSQTQSFSVLCYRYFCIFRKMLKSAYITTLEIIKIIITCQNKKKDISNG